MRPAMKPRLMAHLREMLVEKDEDIAALQERVRVSEAGHQEASRRVEQLTALLEKSRSDPQYPKGHGDQSKEQVRLSQTFVEQLREQLSVSSAGRMALASENEQLRSDAEALRAEVAEIRQKHSPDSSGAEIDELRQQLSKNMDEASLLRSRLQARDAEVARLEKRVAELETAALGAPSRPSLTGEPLDYTNKAGPDSAVQLPCGGGIIRELTPVRSVTPTRENGAACIPEVTSTMVAGAAGPLTTLPAPCPPKTAPAVVAVTISCTTPPPSGRVMPAPASVDTSGTRTPPVSGRAGPSRVVVRGSTCVSPPQSASPSLSSVPILPPSSSLAPYPVSAPCFAETVVQTRPQTSPLTGRRPQLSPPVLRGGCGQPFGFLEGPGIFSSSSSVVSTTIGSHTSPQPQPLRMVVRSSSDPSLTSASHNQQLSVSLATWSKRRVLGGDQASSFT